MPLFRGIASFLNILLQVTGSWENWERLLEQMKSVL